MQDIMYFFTGIIFVLLFNMANKYFEKKTSNLADIEDSPILTKIEERIKQDYRKELSLINNKLKTLTNRSLLVDEKSIQVLNNFYERCLIIKDLHSQNLGDFIAKDLEHVLTEYQMKVENAHRKLYSDYHYLALFHIKNAKIIECVNEILPLNGVIKSTFTQNFGKIKNSIILESGLSRVGSYSKAVVHTDGVIKDYYTEQKANIEQFNEHFQNLQELLSNFFSEYGLNLKHKEVDHK